MSAGSFSLFNAKETLPFVFVTGKVRYTQRIIATFEKASVKQFFFKHDSCARAVFIFEPGSGDERK